MKYLFDVPEMSCGHCKARIESTLLGNGKVENCSVDLNSGTVSVESELKPEKLEELFDEAGYDAFLKT